jgi:3-deoxy-D-manno-octulosonate 8-phosphate phosphatase (KDO 8-P phosphatase)
VVRCPSVFCTSTTFSRRALFSHSVKRVPIAVRKKAARIRLLLLDVDGVLTDGGIMVDDRGLETKRFDVRDGLGIALLIRAGIEVGFITGRSSRVVTRRARELKVRMVYQGVQDKPAAYAKIKRRMHLTDDQVAYIGDDIVDLPLLKTAGLGVAVPDGGPELQRRVDYVTRTPGGKGAVREVAELLLKSQGKWDNLTSQYYRE